MNANDPHFESDHRPTPSVEFDFAAVDREAEQIDHQAAVAYYRDKLTEFVRFTCDALLAGNPTAEQAGRRAYFFALALKQPPFETQSELAAHLGLTKGAISQQLNSFIARNPLLLMPKR